MQKFKPYYILFLLTLPCVAWAQLEQYPLEKKKPSQKSSSRTQAPILYRSLPFWDDFSFAGEHPVDSFWVDYEKVLVNSGQAINPPTIKVATFDGLNENGLAYSPNPTDILDYGYRDTLESQPIKLTEVIAANRDSVFFSFFYQAGGRIEPPNPNDFLRLEFKSIEGWKSVDTLRIASNFDPAVFTQVMIKIQDTPEIHYFHDEFRFRFISFGRKSGRFDSWHIDYVYLNEHRSLGDPSLPDRSLSTFPSTIFGQYYSVPIKHFFNQPEINTTSFYIWNLFKNPTQLSYTTSLLSKKNYESSSVTSSVTLDFQTPLTGVGGVSAIDAFALREISLATLPDPNNASIFDPAAKGIELTMTLELVSGDNKHPSLPDSDYDKIYEPIDFRWNDTLRVHFNLDSVYAYDDGVAEYAAGLTTAGNQLAYEFFVHAGQDSIVNGVDIYFPSFAGTNPAEVEIFVLDSLIDGEPISPLYEETIDTDQNPNNEFRRIDFSQGVIVRDTFYIGYREPTSGRVRVGLDKSNDSGNRMYFRLTENSAWQPNDRIVGSLMIRPRFGPRDITVGLPETSSRVSIYPNPNRGSFYMKGPVDQLQITTITGEPVYFSAEDMGDDEKRIDVSAPRTGLYIVRYRSGSQVFTGKIVISE